MKELTDEELLRYSRQIMLPQLEVEGQEKICSATALVVGAGGLGSPAAMYLVAAGIGKLVIIDHDVVESSNLQRQLLHSTTDIGKPKTESARQTLEGLNPGVEVETLSIKADGENLAEPVQGVDVVLDCTDNFTIRFALNRLCHRHSVPLVSAAAIRFEGQLSVFDFRDSDSPCYQCLYPEQGDEDMSCARNGVLAPVVGVLGSMQAVEALKIVAGMGNSLAGRLLLYEALHSEWRELKLPKDPGCPVCS